MMSPEERVLRQLIEALAYEGVLTPIRDGWQIGGLSIHAPHRIGGFGRVRLLGAPVAADGHPLRVPDVLAALAATGQDTKTLACGLTRSARFLAAAGPVRPSRLGLRGPDLESSLIEGHPYHPCFKSRMGFSDADNAAFGPEGGASFHLVWLSVAADLARSAGSPLDAGFGLPDPDGRVLVPLHPWQWRNLSQLPEICAWQARGLVAVVPDDGPAMRATQSLRTLAPFDGGDHLKLSLSVGVTSSVRDLAPWSVAVAPAISDWLSRVVAEDAFFSRSPLTVLAEHGAVIVAPQILGGRLAAIRRKSPPEDAIPVNALSLCELDGTPLIASWLRRHGVERWVQQFLNVTLWPVWHLMCRHGIGIEAHGQNMLLRQKDGWPVGLVARDFHESLEYVPGLLARPELVPDLAAMHPAFADAPDGLYHRMGAATDLRDLVLDCLAVHVLSDLADLLHRRDLLPESRFWAMTRRSLALYAQGAGHPDPALGLSDPHIPAECLAGRVLGRSAATHSVPNPLSKVIPMPAFFIDDSRIDPAALDLPDLLADTDPAFARIALHLNDPAECLAQILRLRAAGASVYPIHAELPHDQALALARAAGCTLLASADGPTPLAGPAEWHPGGVLIQMSSGTTGTPKIITRSWAAIETEIAAYIRAFPEAAGMTPVIAAPITHSYGLIAGALVALERGKAPVILSSVNPKAILRRLAGMPDALLYAAPALLHVLARLAGPAGLAASVMTSGTVLPKPWFDSIKTAARALFQQYGCSEAGCIALTTAPQSPEDMGRPLPHLGLYAGSGSDPAPVQVGIADQRIDTGDLGIIDACGHLIFAARAAEVIDVAGINVYPAEIERIALSAPGVDDAVAFAMPDPSAHQRPALAYRGSIAPDALSAFLADHLSQRQRPARLFAVAAMPRGPSGKISRRELAQSLIANEVPA